MAGEEAMTRPCIAQSILYECPGPSSTPWELGGLETCVVPAVRVYFYSLGALVLDSSSTIQYITLYYWQPAGCQSAILPSSLSLSCCLSGKVK